MQDVLTGKILRRSTKRHLRFKDLQTDLTPFADRLKRDASIDKRVSELTSVCP